MSLEDAAIAEWPANVGSRETAYEFVYRVLRHAVLDGTLKEGTRLFQTEIGERLGVSTTPVREALHKLASEGLVDFGAGRGAVVHVLSRDEWREIVHIRRLLEPDALRRSGERVGTQTLAEAERIHREMDGETDVVAWVDLNRQFHSIHYDAAESPRLARILMILLDASTTYLVRAIVEHPEIARQAQAEHAAIIEGLRRRDGDALEEIAIRHLETALPA
jgi:DNA-binding GntR family transcriptional regulator